MGLHDCWTLYDILCILMTPIYPLPCVILLIVIGDFLQVHKGLDSNGVDMSGVECDTVDEIEQLLDRFDCDDMYGRRESKKEARAEQVFEDLYKVCTLVSLCIK